MEINDPLVWYIAGPLIGLFVPLFLWLTGREFGISSSYRHLCAALLPKAAVPRIPYLNYNWAKEGGWQLTLVLGLIAGGAISTYWLGGAGVPLQIPGASDWPGWLILFSGGVLVGFGTRWADGCTSGHTINGIAHLNISSIIASCCFVLGGTIASLVDRLVFGGIIP
jgi:uncharacterized protein